MKYIFDGLCGLQQTGRENYGGLREGGGTSVIDYERPQSYTPKFLADKILTNRSTIEGERKLVTVLFADVANYTALSEKLDLKSSAGCGLLMVRCRAHLAQFLSFFRVFALFVLS
jgi:hypothetical protein